MDFDALVEKSLKNYRRFVTWLRFLVYRAGLVAWLIVNVSIVLPIHSQNHTESTYRDPNQHF